MTEGFDPGALLGAFYPLPDGTRVRLRLAALSDGPRVRDLLEAAGAPDAELQAARLVRLDPRRRLVLCASALIDGGEQLVGVGAIGLGPEAPLEPELVLAQAPALSGVQELLQAALVGRARALRRGRVA